MQNESIIRLSAFLGVIMIMAVAERASPRRVMKRPRGRRWFRNVGVSFLSSALARVALPLAPAAAAVYVNEKGWGFFNAVAFPYWLKVAASIVILDVVIYLQHVMFHAVPVLWRVHQMHHADLEIDASTGIRFHPIEIILSIFIKIAVVAALGTPVLAIVLFEIILNACALFNHGNLRLPQGLDRRLRLFLVTPDMHRVHHSVIIHETNSNFGFCVSWWDRIFGTYKDQPMRGHDEMTIGLSHIRDGRRVTFWRMLLIPFTEKPGAYPLNRQTRK